METNSPKYHQVTLVLPSFHWSCTPRYRPRFSRPGLYCNRNGNRRNAVSDHLERQNVSASWLNSSWNVYVGANRGGSRCNCHGRMIEGTQICYSWWCCCSICHAYYWIVRRHLGIVTVTTSL